MAEAEAIRTRLISFETLFVIAIGILQQFTELEQWQITGLFVVALIILVVIGWQLSGKWTVRILLWIVAILVVGACWTHRIRPRTTAIPVAMDAIKAEKHEPASAGPTPTADEILQSKIDAAIKSAKNAPPPKGYETPTAPPTRPTKALVEQSPRSDKLLGEIRELVEGQKKGKEEGARYPKTLDFDMRSKLLAQLALGKGSVNVLAMIGNVPAQRLAIELADVLKVAGWTVFGPSQAPINPPLEGLVVQARSVDTPGAVLLLRALQSVGIATEGQIRETLPEGRIDLFIGSRLPG